MFPNVRFMVVALLASIAAMSCGFGVFAAFRVNHGPLAPLPAATSPFLRIADATPPPAATFATGRSFGSRFQLNEALIAGAAAGLSAQMPDDDTRLAPLTVSATLAAKSDKDVLTAPAAVAPAPQAAPPVKPDDAAIVEAAPAEPDNAATQAPATPELPIKEAVQEPESESASTPAPAAEAPAVAEHKAVGGRRVAARPRARVARAPAAVQPAAFPQFPQSSFQSPQPAAFSAQTAPAPTKRQVVLRVVRARTPAKTVTEKPSAQPSDTAVGGPFFPAPPQ